MSKIEEPLRIFGLKYIDIMLGVILGLGLQWWANLTEIWQYILFIFVFLNLIDYWIDYTPTLNNYPLRKEVDVIIHAAIVLLMFFMTYSIQISLFYFFVVFILFRVFDIIWIWRIRRKFEIKTSHLKYLKTWRTFDFIEAIGALTLLILLNDNTFTIQTLALTFIGLRIITRIWASLIYKTGYFKG